MSAPKRQRTVHVRIHDRESGWWLYTSIRITRTALVLNATPSICLPGATAMRAIETDVPWARLELRAAKLGVLLRHRWWGTP